MLVWTSVSSCLRAFGQKGKAEPRTQTAFLDKSPEAATLACVFAGDKPHKCDFCDKCFSRKDNLAMHMRCHTSVKPHKCHLCDYAAVDSSSLKKHLRIHSDERPYKCQLCPYASRNSSQLTVHLRSHTGKSQASLHLRPLGAHLVKAQAMEMTPGCE